MTNELIESELGKTPFVPFRLHLASGQTIDILTARGADAMGSAVMVYHPLKDPDVDPGYDLISLYSIERLEQLEDESE
jgi:hypothetical protein